MSISGRDCVAYRELGEKQMALKKKDFLLQTDNRQRTKVFLEVLADLKKNLRTLVKVF